MTTPTTPAPVPTPPPASPTTSATPASTTTPPPSAPPKEPKSKAKPVKKSGSRRAYASLVDDVDGILASNESLLEDGKTGRPSVDKQVADLKKQRKALVLRHNKLEKLIARLIDLLQAVVGKIEDIDAKIAELQPPPAATPEPTPAPRRGRLRGRKDAGNSTPAPSAPTPGKASASSPTEPSAKKQSFWRSLIAEAPTDTEPTKTN